LPTHDYTCPLCAITFEAVKRITEDNSIAACPKCGGAADKQHGAPALKFIGRGWTPKHYPGK
jgi:putative FmdB family regulatory protein